MPSEEEKNNINADDTETITALNSLKYMSLGKRELEENIEESKEFVKMLGQYGSLFKEKK